MAIINMRKYYYPLIREDTFVEVPDEVADALLELWREEKRLDQKIRYYKAFFSLDYCEWMENYVLENAPSPEEILVKEEKEIEHNQMLKLMNEALESISPVQARRIYSHYMQGMKLTEIARMEGVNPSSVWCAVDTGLKKLRLYIENEIKKDGR